MKYDDFKEIITFGQVLLVCVSIIAVPLWYRQKTREKRISELNKEHTYEVQNMFYRVTKDDPDFSAAYRSSRDIFDSVSVMELIDKGLVDIYFNGNAGAGNMAFSIQFKDKNFRFFRKDPKTDGYDILIITTPPDTGYMSRAKTHIKITFNDINDMLNEYNDAEESHVMEKITEAFKNTYVVYFETN